MNNSETIFYDHSISRKVIEGNSFEELLGSLNHLSKEEKEALRKSSKEILSKCIPAKNHNNPDSNVGLVIGKIQSGKTTSFTSVLALARDNDYKIAIIIAGRTNLLLKQTFERLNKDLSIDNDLNISVNKDAYERDLADVLIRQLNRRQKKSRLFVIPVLKHQDHLKKIKDHLSHPLLQNELKTNSVLIIDDEADQASLNTFARTNASKGEDNASAIFSAIRNLRNVIPNHSFIQYTATPQANLLLDTFSLLSPDWHVILKPGTKYTGGIEFFTNQKKLVRNIKNEGAYPESYDELGIEPPSSLRESICEYLILASLMGGVGENEVVNKKATMLIHPSWRVNQSNKGEKGIKDFHVWTQKIVESLDLELDDGDYDSFRQSYESIKEDFKDDKDIIVPELEEICDFIYENILYNLPHSIRNVIGESKELKDGYPWESNNYHILVGGTLLDRGFTVENLIMTYMPRDSKGKNQADTIEQRCRFYGYRLKYLKFCRVYITQSLKEDFISYNKYEDFIINYLQNNSLTDFYNGDNLQQLDPNLNLTNRNRISNDIKRVKIEESKIWFEPQPLSLKLNNDHIRNHLTKGSIKWIDYKPKSNNFLKDIKNVSHKIARVESNLIFDIIKGFKTDNPYDTSKYYNLMCHLDYKLNDIKFGWIVQIAPDANRQRTIKRKFNRKDMLNVSALRFGGHRDPNGGVSFKDIDVLINPNWGADVELLYDNEIVLYIYKFSPKNNNENLITEEHFYIPNFYFPPNLSSQYIQTIDINDV